VRWLTQKTVLSADAFFDVMDQRYQENLRTAFVGERAYLRIVDPMSDTNSGKDRVTVLVPVSGGSVTQSLSLVETFPHSGVFKGSFLATYSGTASNIALADVVPVNYGDTVNLGYRPASGGALLNRSLLMQKGADGRILPFTKRFKEPELAVQTQFTIAEAYFELAKKQRDLKQEELARREIAQGKKLLEEAIRDYPETEERAHADYLLANLAMESAEEIKDEEGKKQRYMEAITRFGDLVSTYPMSPYAPKSQFKKALAFDKLGQLDQACEEYVKLSYRYPENELVAETIARLGQYFMTKGKEMQAQVGAETDVVKKEKARLQMLEMYKSSARVFERLAVRFPDHALAWKTTVLAAQCWIRAEDLDRAIVVFGNVIDAKKADPDLLAQSMYWRGDCFMKKQDYENAYRMLKRLTWDYPETTWAKYARGRLSEKELASVEEKESQK
jgi:TolA-binding protein